MNVRSRSRRPVTLENVVYGIALRKAARLGGAFRPETSRQVVVLLKLPPGAVPERYEAAAVLMAREAGLVHRLAIVLPKTTRKGMLDIAPVEDLIRTDCSLLVLWPPGQAIPRNRSCREIRRIVPSS